MPESSFLFSLHCLQFSLVNPWIPSIMLGWNWIKDYVRTCSNHFYSDMLIPGVAFQSHVFSGPEKNPNLQPQIPPFWAWIWALSGVVGAVGCVSFLPFPCLAAPRPPATLWTKKRRFFALKWGRQIFRMEGCWWRVCCRRIWDQHFFGTRFNRIWNSIVLCRFELHLFWVILLRWIFF